MSPYRVIQAVYLIAWTIVGTTPLVIELQDVTAFNQDENEYTSYKHRHRRSTSASQNDIFTSAASASKVVIGNKHRRLDPATMQNALQMVAADVEKEKQLIDSKLGRSLSYLYEQSIGTNHVHRSTEFSEQEFVYTVDQVDYITVDVIGDDSTRIQSVLSSNGFTVVSCYEHVCAVELPVLQLKKLAQISQVKLVKKAPAERMQGLVMSEGDKSMFADQARTKYGVNGTGLLIGVLSDSFNCLRGQVNNTQTGDLPPLSRIMIIKDYIYSGCADEGRAMMQVIHDIAPGARLAFHTAYDTESKFATGIQTLMNAGCDIIVDDVLYYDEPMYQDGIVAQAVNRAVRSGVAYFSSAGNQGGNTWDAPKGFLKSGIIERDIGEYHAFGMSPDGQPVYKMLIGIPFLRSDVTTVFQWAEPYLSANGKIGSKSDINILLLGENGANISGTNNNIGKDPIERFKIVPSDYESGGDDFYVNFELFIALKSGPPPKHMKLVLFGIPEFESVFFDSRGGRSTIYGHFNTALGASVGAAFYADTPAYQISPPIISIASAIGGLPVFYNTSGYLYSAPQVRQQPRFVGPDGVLTSFFERRKRFYGTSAAASHVAAVAALLLQRAGGKKKLAPSVLYKLLQDTAIDMDNEYTRQFDVGFDYNTGYGFVNASAAVARVPLPAPTKTPVPVPRKAPVPVPRAPVPVPKAPVPIPRPTPRVPAPVPRAPIQVPRSAPRAPVPIPRAPVPVPRKPIAPIPVPIRAPSKQMMK